MQRLKRFLLYLLLVVVLALAVCAVFRGLVSDCLASAFGDAGRASYFRAAISADGDIGALGVRDGEIILTTGFRDGSRTHRDIMPEIPDVVDYRADALFACRSGGYMLSLYTFDEDGNADRFILCYISDDGKETSVLVKRACSGDGVTERLASVRVSSFAEDGDNIRFAVWDSGECEIFSFVTGGIAMTALDKFECEAFVSAAVLADGSVVMYTADGRLVNSASPDEAAAAAGVAPLRMWLAENSVYVLDGISGRVALMDAADYSADEVFALDSIGVEDLSVASTGLAAILTNDGELLYYDGIAAESVSTVLYRSAWMGIVILAALLIAVCFAAYALWYALCEVRRLRITLIVRKGALLLAIMALVVGGCLELLGEPYFDTLAERQAQSTIRSTMALLKDADVGDRQSLQAAAAALGNSDKAYGETSFYSFSISGDRFTTVATSAGLGAGVDAESLLYGPEFTTALARAALAGEASVSFEHNGAAHYAYVLRVSQTGCIAAVVDGWQLARQYDESFRQAEYAVWIAAAVMFVVVLLMLTQTRAGLRRVAKGMDTLSEGNTNVVVVERGGDELEWLADSFNTLARNLRATVGGNSRKGESYMRFVPQQIITLLGADSIEDVDKHTFSSRYMATMSVRFLFDEKVYESRNRELFDNINEVIERTAGIISQNGGTVYDFSHDGYDALFEADNDAAVSAAVTIRQEVIALNRDRSKDGASQVQLHIALDVGDVMMGIVGDETRMEATAISSSFNTTRMLTTLFSRFEANILCTEGIINRAESYGSRYIGKTRDGDDMIRVYEIFDGDAYSTRAGKAATSREFSDGVYTLYSRDFAAAKRIFMDIARKNGTDGVARFYLYLADRFEKDAPDEISLDY